MIRFGVRALLVVRDQRTMGLITSYDIQGERPLQFLQELELQPAPGCAGRRRHDALAAAALPRVAQHRGGERRRAAADDSAGRPDAPDRRGERQQRLTRRARTGLPGAPGAATASRRTRTRRPGGGYGQHAISLLAPAPGSSAARLKTHVLISNGSFPLRGGLPRVSVRHPTLGPLSDLPTDLRERAQDSIAQLRTAVAEYGKVCYASSLGLDPLCSRT